MIINDTIKKPISIAAAVLPFKKKILFQLKLINQLR